MALTNEDKIYIKEILVFLFVIIVTLIISHFLG